MQSSDDDTNDQWP